MVVFIFKKIDIILCFLHSIVLFRCVAILVVGRKGLFCESLKKMCNEAKEFSTRRALV